MLAFCVNDSVQEREGCTVTGEGRTARVCMAIVLLFL